MNESPDSGPVEGRTAPDQAATPIIQAIVVNPEKIIADWTRRLAILTALLVLVSLISAVVSALQWWEIRRGASDANAQQRAWIGANSAEINNFSLNKPLMSTLRYSNFEKNPSAVNHEYRSLLIDIDEWKKDAGREKITHLEDSCKNMGRFEGESVGVLFHDNNYYDQEADLVVDKDVVDGKKVFVRMDCFVYKFENNDVHSHICYYFINGDPDSTTMFICSYGFFSD